jgi:hypothetical protein
MDIAAIGRQFGLDEQQTQSAFDALVPVVAAGLRRNGQSDDGLTSLLGALASGRHVEYAEDPDRLTAQDTMEDGNAILGHIFGSKDVSRGVAQQLSASSGIGSDILKKLLPVVAAYVMSQIARSAMGGRGSSGGGGLGDILGSILGGSGASPQGQSGGGLGDILGGILGGAMQQSGGQGGGLGDILGSVLGGGAGQDEPAPQPRGRRQAQPGGGLDDTLRDVLGGGSPEANERIGRTRQSLDSMLGGGTARGTAADDLLNSVDRMVRGR